MHSEHAAFNLFHLKRIFYFSEINHILLTVVGILSAIAAYH